VLPRDTPAPSQHPVNAMFECSGISLPAHSTLRRDSPRPVEFRQEGYGSAFDEYTLFYDVFQANVGPGGWVVLLGPPWLNLFPLLQDLRIGGQSLAHMEAMMCFRDRCADIWVQARPGDQLTLGLASETMSVPFQRDHCALYEGRRVLYTLSRDNDMAWVRDWVGFHVRNHGADGVLVYDNNSSKYDPVDLEQLLRATFPHVETNVVRWPYPYGPGGYSGKSWWDSDFCQAGAFQHARFRFLASASSVLNCDVDELVVSTRGERVFETTERTKLGYLCFGGRWISSASTADTEDRQNWRPARHGHYAYLERLAGVCPLKWCVVPKECLLCDQWKTHRVSGKGDTECFSAEFAYRHFRAISTDWKYKRSQLVRVDPATHEFDAALDQAFKSAGL